LCFQPLLQPRFGGNSRVHWHVRTKRNRMHFAFPLISLSLQRGIWNFTISKNFAFSLPPGIL
jgi:hypothetical protein